MNEKNDFIVRDGDAWIGGNYKRVSWENNNDLIQISELGIGGRHINIFEDTLNEIVNRLKKLRKEALKETVDKLEEDLKRGEGE